MVSYQDCTQVSAACPVSASSNGYAPNLAGNAFMCAMFGLCMISQAILGVRYRVWTWMIALMCGLILEFVGYIGRIQLHYNVWDSPATKINIVCLILAPSCISAGINLTLKHFVIIFGREHSLLKPALYTWIFISTDIFSICVQAIGGGVAAAAASADDNIHLLNVGDDLIMAGIAIQVFQLVVFGAVSALYFLRLYHDTAGQASRLPKLGQHYFAQKRFRFFCGALIVAYVTILCRCCFRLPEMAHGWGQGLQRDETAFLVLDGAMILIASLALTLFHPGFCFPELSRRIRDQRKVEEEADRESQTPNSASREDKMTESQQVSAAQA